MKNLFFSAVALLLVGTASAQTVHRVQSVSVVKDFAREMPCTNAAGDVIASQIGTVCLPYAPTLIEGATLYELVSASADEWIFQSVSEPQANTPYVYRVDDDAQQVIFHGQGDYDRSRSEVPGSAAGHEGAFVGTYRNRVVRTPVYYFSGDKICYTEQPITGTAFRCYFTTDVMPEGQKLSDNVRLTFVTPAGLRALQSQSADADVTVDQHNIGIAKGDYQMGGKKVLVK